MSPSRQKLPFVGKAKRTFQLRHRPLQRTKEVAEETRRLAAEAMSDEVGASE
jgi:hypothetical protein